MESSIANTVISLVAQRVKCLTAMWETSVRSQSLEDPLEEGMATSSVATAEFSKFVDILSAAL